MQGMAESGIWYYRSFEFQENVTPPAPIFNLVLLHWRNREKPHTDSLYSALYLFLEPNKLWGKSLGNFMDDNVQDVNLHSLLKNSFVIL